LIQEIFRKLREDLFVMSPSATTRAQILEYIATRYLMKEVIFKFIKEYTLEKSLIHVNFAKKCLQLLVIETIMREDILKINLTFVILQIIVGQNITENISS
jgi:hypothetical protein